MLHRVFALMLTAVTIGAPLSLTVCHAECADRAADRDQPAHHSCHESGDAAAVGMKAVPHACGHTDEAPAGLERVPQTVAAPVAVMGADSWSPVPQRVAVDRVTPADTGPPPTTRPTQLRV